METVLDHKEVRRGKQRKLEYLVKWLGYGNEHNTFEPANNLANAADEVRRYWQSKPPEARLVSAVLIS